MNCVELLRQLDAIGKERARAQARKERVDRNAMRALLKVGLTPGVSMAVAADLLGLSRQAAYGMLERARRAEL